MVFARPPNGNAQCTINEIVPWVGIGLHSECRVSMHMHPAAPNSGIFLVRTDVPAAHSLIHTSWIDIVDTLNVHAAQHSGNNVATPLQPDLPFANQCALFDLAGMIQ
jgi:UDP-3-O-acyl-N-acetylglucosamine deacetylase